MTKQVLCILAVLCCGCIGVLNDATSVAIVFKESDKVCVRGNMYDVSDKKKSFDLRCNIKYARELVFEHIGKASARALWNIADPASDDGCLCGLAPIFYSVRVGNGKQLPIFFGPRSAYFVSAEDETIDMVSVSANVNPSDIDFSVYDSSNGIEVSMEVICDLNMRKCDNLEKILCEFIKHGSGIHQVFLTYY